MFGLDLWLIWLIVGIFFIISEIFTAGFVMLPIGLAALASSLIAYLWPSAGIAPQVLAFIITGTAFIFFGQKLADKIVKEPEANVGADRWKDKAGVVVETIDSAKNTGRVRISQDEWRARSEDDEVIKEGVKIKVIEVDGTRLIVKKA